MTNDHREEIFLESNRNTLEPSYDFRSSRENLLDGKFKATFFLEKDAINRMTKGGGFATVQKRKIFISRWGFTLYL